MALKPGSGGGAPQERTVLRNASAGVLQQRATVGETNFLADTAKKQRAGRDDDDRDPVKAVLNRLWEKKDEGNDRKSRARRMLSSSIIEMSKEQKEIQARKGAQIVALGLKSGLENKGLNVPAVSLPAVTSAAAAAKDPSPLPSPKEEPTSPAAETAEVGKVIRRAAQGDKKMARRWTVNVFADEEVENLASPRFRERPKNIPAFAKLETEEDTGGSKEGEEKIAKRQSSKTAVDDVAAHKFCEFGTKLGSLTGQTNVRIQIMLTKIKDMHNKDANYLSNSNNYERLVEVHYLVAIVNYKLAKWSHVMQPRNIPQPQKPQMVKDSKPSDIISELQYSLSRMEVLSSTLAGMLNKISLDARNMRKNEDGEIITPRSRNPLKLAAARGLTQSTIDEFYYIGAHLENLLSVAGNLAHKPHKDPVKQLMLGIGTLIAINRFKKKIVQKRKS